MNRFFHPPHKFLSYAFVVIAYGVFVGIFALYQEKLGLALAPFAVIPVIVGSWYFGIRGGMLTAIILFLAMAFLRISSGKPYLDLFGTPDVIIGDLSLVFVALVVGRMATVTRERKRLIHELEKVEKYNLIRLSFLELLNDITGSALKADSVEATLRVLVKHVAELFEADHGFFGFWDPVNKAPIPIVAYGSTSDTYRNVQFMPGEQSLAAAIIEFGHPLAVPDIANSPYVSKRIASEFPGRSMLGLPLIAENRKLATLILGYNNTRTFDHYEVAHAEMVARQIALVVTKIQLLEDARKQVRQLTALHEVAVISTQVRSVDELIDQVTEIIGRNLFPDNFGILLLDEEKGLLHPHPSYRFVSNKNSFPEFIHLGEGVTGQVAQTGATIRIDNVKEFEQYLDVDGRTVSELCVPIKLRDHVLGVINTESTQGEAFSPDDELLLDTFAGQLANSMEHLRAAESERKWLNQLAHSNDLIYALAHITTHIEKALDAEEIIETLGKALQEINLTCIMAQYDADQKIFATNYTSLNLERLQKLESRVGMPLVRYTFSLDDLKSRLQINEFSKPSVVYDHAQEVGFLFGSERNRAYANILKKVGVDPEVEVLRLPLMFEEHLLGILWVWGQLLTKEDLPIMSIFAKQIGISLERARLFQEVQNLALTDPLTGLQNRRSLFELGRIEFSRAQRMERPFCGMMVDLDHFKQINDKYGHPVGDQVLQEFAKRCQSSVREVDLVGRYGGEEIIILLPEMELNVATYVGERVRTKISETPIIVSGHEIRITASIGVAQKDEYTRELRDSDCACRSGHVYCQAPGEKFCGTEQITKRDS